MEAVEAGGGEGNKVGGGGEGCDKGHKWWRSVVVLLWCKQWWCVSVCIYIVFVVMFFIFLRRYFPHNMPHQQKYVNLAKKKLTKLGSVKFRSDIRK